jgi:hypothetical protein
VQTPSKEKRAPVAAASAPQPAPSRKAPGVLGYVDETMKWLADEAGGGPPPKLIRPER